MHYSSGRYGWTAGNTDYTGACLNAFCRLERKLRLLGNRPEDNNNIIIIRWKHHLDGMSSGVLELNTFKGLWKKEGHRYREEIGLFFIFIRNSCDLLFFF